MSYTITEDGTVLAPENFTGFTQIPGYEFVEELFEENNVTNKNLVTQLCDWLTETAVLTNCQIVFVEGLPGCGKSTLIAEINNKHDDTLVGINEHMYVRHWLTKIQKIPLEQQSWDEVSLKPLTVLHDRNILYTNLGASNMIAQIHAMNIAMAIDLKPDDSILFLERDLYSGWTFEGKVEKEMSRPAPWSESEQVVIEVMLARYRCMYVYIDIPHSTCMARWKLQGKERSHEMSMGSEYYDRVRKRIQTKFMNLKNYSYKMFLSITPGVEYSKALRQVYRRVAPKTFETAYRPVANAVAKNTPHQITNPIPPTNYKTLSDAVSAVTYSSKFRNVEYNSIEESQKPLSLQSLQSLGQLKGIDYLREFVKNDMASTAPIDQQPTGSVEDGSSNQPELVTSSLLKKAAPDVKTQAVGTWSDLKRKDYGFKLNEFTCNRKSEDELVLPQELLPNTLSIEEKVQLVYLVRKQLVEYICRMLDIDQSISQSTQFRTQVINNYWVEMIDHLETLTRTEAYVYARKHNMKEPSSICTAKIDSGFCRGCRDRFSLVLTENLGPPNEYVVPHEPLTNYGVYQSGREVFCKINPQLALLHNYWHWVKVNRPTYISLMSSAVDALPDDDDKLQATVDINQNYETQWRCNETLSWTTLITKAATIPTEKFHRVVDFKNPPIGYTLWDQRQTMTESFDEEKPPQEHKIFEHDAEVVSVLDSPDLKQMIYSRLTKLKDMFEKPMLHFLEQITTSRQYLWFVVGLTKYCHFLCHAISGMGPRIHRDYGTMMFYSHYESLAWARLDMTHRSETNRQATLIDKSRLNELDREWTNEKEYLTDFLTNERTLNNDAPKPPIKVTICENYSWNTWNLLSDTNQIRTALSSEFEHMFVEWTQLVRTSTEYYAMTQVLAWMCGVLEFSFKMKIHNYEHVILHIDQFYKLMETRLFHAISWDGPEANRIVNRPRFNFDGVMGLPIWTTPSLQRSLMTDTLTHGKVDPQLNNQIVYDNGMQKIIVDRTYDVKVMPSISCFERAFKAHSPQASMAKENDKILDQPEERELLTYIPALFLMNQPGFDALTTLLIDTFVPGEKDIFLRTVLGQRRLLRQQFVFGERNMVARLAPLEVDTALTPEDYVASLPLFETPKHKAEIRGRLYDHVCRRPYTAPLLFSVAHHFCAVDKSPYTCDELTTTKQEIEDMEAEIIMNDIRQTILSDMANLLQKRIEEAKKNANPPLPDEPEPEPTPEPPPEPEPEPENHETIYT